MNGVSAVIDILGLQETASSQGVSYQAVRKWERSGTPAERVIPLCEATGWQVIPHDLRPDIYRHPEDGLPAELRGLHQEASA